jgi:hypothetical protein
MAAVADDVDTGTVHVFWAHEENGVPTGVVTTGTLPPESPAGQ